MDIIFAKALNYLPQILQGLGCVFISWLWWSAKKVFVRHEDINVLSDRLRQLESQCQNRLIEQQRIEETLERLPTSKDIQALNLSVVKVEGDIKSMGHKFDGFTHTTSRLERTMDLFMEVHMGSNK